VSAWRHVRAIGLLPVSATLVVPAVLIWAFGGVDVGWGLPAAAAWLPVVLGAALIGLGLYLVVRTIALFARVGQGTLAPWDPTSRLVVLGPYRHVRNPMISAVLAVLIGEALVFASPGLALYCAIFFAVNWIYFVLHEEPGLERRFGAAYREYKRAVPRWLPRP
jgi:protein-S-isoprenylcysteine O-methyltransferase Ste14